jgi:hypothetical protein
MGLFVKKLNKCPFMTPKNLIQTSGYLVVCQKTCSFSLLQNRLLIDSETTHRILSILEGLGIIGFDGFVYTVAMTGIEELEKVFDILFEKHQKKFHDK